MSLKDEFIIALQEDLPAGVLNFATTPIPVLTAITDPTDVDSAIIAQGVLAANLNKIFQAFEGLTPVDVLLHIGQNSVTSIGLLLSNLESIEQTSQGTINIIAPEAGAVYYGYFAEFLCQDDEYDSVVVSVGELGEEEMSSQGVMWEASFPIPIGGHTATFTAYKGDQVITDSVSFSVVSWDIYPADGETVQAGEITVSVDPKGINVVSAVVTIAGEAYDLVWNGAALAWEVASDITEFAGQTIDFLFTVTTAANDIIEQLSRVIVD